MATWTVHRARIAAIKRHHPDADVSAEVRNLRAARATDYVQQLVASAPPLSFEQRSRLAAILLSAGGDT